MDNKTLIIEVAYNLGTEVDEVRVVLDEFFLQLHRRTYEYVGVNGDYVGEELHFNIGQQAFYHFVGFLHCFTGIEGYADELLARLGSRAEWIPYRHQTDGWKKPSE